MKIGIAKKQFAGAKVLFIGSDNAGKSSLVYRLRMGAFSPTPPTEPIWVPPIELPVTLRESKYRIERKVWIWDFAGHADYRLIHQIFLNGTALLVTVFDPQREDLLQTLSQWDRDLQKINLHTCKKLLVAGRYDRGGLLMSRNIINQFCGDHRFEGYIETSALTGEGCAELAKAIFETINWKRAAKASIELFNHGLTLVSALLAKGETLFHFDEFKARLSSDYSITSMNREDLEGVVSLLASCGILWHLEHKTPYLLLEPHFLLDYANSIINTIRAHREEIGCLAEASLLDGQLSYQSRKRLPKKQESVLLDYLCCMFTNRRICLNELTEKGSVMVFPSYFRQKRPETTPEPSQILTYEFKGPPDEIFATLIVKLYHSQRFALEKSWHLAADFHSIDGLCMGVRLEEKTDNSGQLIIYFDQKVSDNTKLDFVSDIQKHLLMRAKPVARIPNYTCPHCDTIFEDRKAIQKKLSSRDTSKDNAKKTYITCPACDMKLTISELIDGKHTPGQFLYRVRELDRRAQINLDNESRELILVGHTYLIAGEAGQIYRQYTNSDHGIDGEIEFKDDDNEASGQRLYLQLKSGDSYLYKRKRDEAEIFTIKNERWADYWQQQAYPVMLVIRTSDGKIRWMNVTEYLKLHSAGGKKVKQIIFDGEPFTAPSLQRMRDTLIPLPG